MELLEEQNLIVACQQGGLEKFGDLYDFYADKIYLYLYYRIRNKEAAQDLTSQTFLKAIGGIKNFNSQKGQFSSWLYCIAKNTLVDCYRSQKEHYSIDELWDLRDDRDLTFDAEIREKIAKVKNCLAKLDGTQREIIILRVWDGLTYREIAQIIGKSEDNCKMIFSRAITKLRTQEVLALLVIGIFVNQLS